MGKSVIGISPTAGVFVPRKKVAEKRIHIPSLNCGLNQFKRAAKDPKRSKKIGTVLYDV